MSPAVVAAILVLMCVLDTGHTSRTLPRGCKRFRPCGAGFSRVENTQNHCLRYFRDPKTFDEAQKVCNDKNSDLVSIPNLQELRNVLCLMEQSNNPGQSIWIGAKRFGTTFRNIDGSAFVFAPWAHGEPNNRGGREDCVAAGYKPWRQFSDENCSSKRHFVCARKR